MSSKDKKCCLEYSEHETYIVAHIVTKFGKECFEQQYMLGKGLKVFKEEGPPACKVELKQMYECKCLKEISVCELTRQESMQAQEGLMLLTRKRSGSVKDRFSYNGKKTRDWSSKENTSSPTVGTDIIVLNIAVDDFKRHDVMVSDVPYAFIQTDAPVKEVGKRVIMKICGKLVNWLQDIDPREYKNLFVMENNQQVIYLVTQKAICGILEAMLLWYWKFRKDLEGQGFKFNEYDACVENRAKNGKQHTIRFHVDGIFSSHINPKVNDAFSV